jgi:hypothetical protein
MMGEMAASMQGRKSFPWGKYQERIMKMSAALIDAGLCSPKDINSMLVDIDNRRKESGGTGDIMSGGDLLAEWLSGKGDEAVQ